MIRYYGAISADEKTYHASIFNGNIAVFEHNHQLNPIESVYLIDFFPQDTNLDLPANLRGFIFISIKQPPIIYDIYKRIASFLIRESSF